MIRYPHVARRRAIQFQHKSLRDRDPRYATKAAESLTPRELMSEIVVKYSATKDLISK